MNAIDKLPVPRLLRIEVGPISAIDKDINNVAKSGENVEMKTLQKERKNVLRSDTFETTRGEITIDDLLIDSAGGAIVFMTHRQLPPQTIDVLERLRPPLMSVASDHVIRGKESGRMQCSMNLVEQFFELHDVMEALHREHDVIDLPGLP